MKRGTFSVHDILHLQDSLGVNGFMGSIHFQCLPIYHFSLLHHDLNLRKDIRPNEPAGRRTPGVPPAVLTLTYLRQRPAPSKMRARSSDSLGEHEKVSGQSKETLSSRSHWRLHRNQSCVNIIRRHLGIAGTRYIIHDV